MGCGKMEDMTQPCVSAVRRQPDPDGLRIWLDGQVYSNSEEAKLSVTDHGLVVGDGVFEALKVTPDGPFATARHLNRMSRSAKSMGLPAPDHDLVRTAIDAVVDGRSWELGKIRITYTGGQGPLGSGEAFGNPTLVVAAQAEGAQPETTTIVTTPWTRNQSGALTGVKSTSYGENVLGLAYAHERDATEGIFLNNAGQVCEGTGTNIFCVFGDRVITPPLQAGPLAGITRELLLEWADIAEEDISLEKAQTADEVFITSSIRDVQGVTAWDAGRFEFGPKTRELAALFAERSQADPDPA